MPPKPKEFDKAIRIGICFEEVKGMKLSLNMGSGSFRLREGGATPCNKTTKQPLGSKSTAVCLVRHLKKGCQFL